MSSKEANPTSNPIARPQKVLFYDGAWYDVTSWIPKHPGGRIIEFYCNSGEDATQAIQQFHLRSLDRAHRIMAPMKTDAPSTKLPILGDKAGRYQLLDQDFKKLNEDLKREGFFDPSPSHYLYRMSELLGMLLLSFIIASYGSFIPGASWVSAVILGIFMGRCGWLMHEAGHHSVTGKPNLDRFLQAIMYGIGCGMSSSWWSSQHNRHHAMPQRLKHDVDLDTLPLLAFNSRVVNPLRPHRAQNIFVKYQSILFLILDTLLVAWMWKLYLHPRYCVQKGRFVDLALMATHYSLIYFFGWKIYLLSVWCGAIYIFGNFAMSHTHLPVTDTALHWVEYALHHTANINPSPVTNWWMGYLNFQIEHHLFPTMPQYRHQEISARVAKFAKEHELPYIRLGYFEALKLTLGNLSKVSKEIQSMKAPAKA